MEQNRAVTIPGYYTTDKVYYLRSAFMTHDREN